MKNITFVKILTESSTKKFSNIFLDKDPEFADDYAVTLTPLELKLHIDKRDKYIKKLEKTLNDKNKLKKIITDKAEMDKLQEVLNKIAKKEIVGNLKDKEEKEDVSGRETMGADFGIGEANLNNLLKIDRLESIGQGVTTIVFKHPKNKKKVIAVTLDAKKIGWLEANKKLFGYTYISKFNYEKGNEAHIFTMNKIDKFFENRDFPIQKMNLIYSEVIVPYYYIVDKKGEAQVKDIDWIIKYMDNIELINILKKVKATYSSNDTLDLHDGQWGLDSNGKILLFDPIIDKRIFSKVNDNNTLNWKITIKHFINDIIFKDEKSERKKIIALLMR